MTKVLIVDDTPFLLKIAQKTLQEKGYEVATATDGKGCLEAVEREKPDVILMDAEMPVMDGWEACAALKAKDEVKNIPVIMCTGDDSQEYKDKARNIGAAGFVVKPYTAEFLVEKIKEVLK
ncbi:MAG: response regulator [Elusimicrobia bacterium]|nr:response regulator [Elusimicrobiota bacterium]